MQFGQSVVEKGRIRHDAVDVIVLGDPGVTIGEKHEAVNSAAIGAVTL
jgi:hypothetical protein